jgi:uncharacterized RDD family membrane protein YckC
MRENQAMAYLPQRDPTNVIGRRIFAFVIDGVLVSAAGVAIFAATKSHSYTGAPTDACRQLRDNGISDPCLQFGSRVYTWTGGKFALAIVLTALVGMLNQVFLQGIAGASVGKMMLGLRVVNERGEVCGVGRAFVRWLLLIVDQFLCFLVGLITVLATHPHRRVGDMVAGTYVVSSADVGNPVVPQAAMAPPYAYAGQAGWTPPQPGVPTWGAPPPPQPPQPQWGAQPPPAWGAEPPPQWGAAPPPPPPPPPWAAPPQPAAAPTAAPPPAAPASWGAPPPPAAPPPVPAEPAGAPPPATEQPERSGESWWDKALGDEAERENE